MRRLRPLEQNIYADLREKAWSGFSMTEKFAQFCEHGMDALKEYVPVTMRPICFDDPAHVLKQIGYDRHVTQLVEHISDSGEVIVLHDQTKNDSRCLFSGHKLSHDDTVYIHEISSDYYKVGFLFCETPKIFKENFNISHDWMLDQIVVQDQDGGVYAFTADTVDGGVPTHIVDVFNLTLSVARLLEVQDDDEAFEMFDQAIRSYMHDHVEIPLQQIRKNNIK